MGEKKQDDSAGGVKMPVNLFVLIAASLGFFQGQVVREGHIYLLRDFSLLISLVLIDYVKNQSRKSKATNYLKKKNPKW